MTKVVFGVVIVFLVICIVVLFTAITIKLYISKIKKYNTILYQKEMAQQKAVNVAIIETQESTLNRISMELHDDAGQQLTYMHLQVENLKLTNPQLNTVITPISDTINQLASTIRHLSHTINQHKIKQYNLQESIEFELERLNKLKSTACALHIIPPFDYTFSDNEKIILYRIFQEISNNMMKHSRATHFEVLFSQSPNISITFKDDGIGFSRENSNLLSSNGLSNIKERAQLINYTFKLQTKPNEGTMIRLEKRQY